MAWPEFQGAMGRRCMRGSAANRGSWEQAVPPALVWFWRLEEEETEGTRQTLDVNPMVKVGRIVC